MKINGLDHTAIPVSDLQKSIDWYCEVLGLSVFQSEENWGPFPIMVLAGETGIALFPKKEGDDLEYLTTRMHIAFRVDQDSFRQFQHLFEQKGIGFSFEDHHYFHSIYLNDPDGYKIELTTPVVGG